MYSYSDYIKRGLKLINNTFIPSNKKLSSIMLYATDRCSAKCKHCNIWAKNPKQHLSFEKIKEIVCSSVVSKSTIIGLEGGEFVLHPEANEILDFLSNYHPNFDLLSNCVVPDKILEAVKKYRPKRLFISLDGGRETHNEIRGVDLYDKVITVIESCKDLLPVSVMFTLTPFNNFNDLQHVVEVCNKYNIDLRVGIYNNMEYFETTVKSIDAESLNFSIKDIPKTISNFPENFDFVCLFTEFRAGNIVLPCRSISDSIVIYPSGDIPICQNKEIILGNVHEESLKKIMTKKSTRILHKQHKHGCNQCWVNFHRKYDIVLYRSLEKIFPKKLLELFLGQYKWCHDKNMTYKDFLKIYI